MKKAFLLLFVFLISTFLAVSARADDLSDVQNQINQKNSEYSSAQDNLAKLKSDIVSINGSLGGTQAELDLANTQVEAARVQVADVEKQLDEKQKTLSYLVGIRNKQIRSLYAHPGLSGFELFVSSQTFASFPEIDTYQKKVLLDSEGLIKIVNDEVLSFQKTQEDLQKTKADLERVAASVATRLEGLKNRYYVANAAQNSVKSQINQILKNLADLTLQQQQLIAAKLAASSQSTTVGSAAPPSVALPSPGFSPAYAIASYGYPHRAGMNQYGAYGRALAGQNFQQILQAYYGRQASSANEPSTIIVSGTNDYGQTFNNQSFAFEDYLKHIYEMPGSWPIEALKAQAVAARTYAFRYGSTICPNQHCQEAKFEYNTTAWQQAVDATAGLVLGGNSPIPAYYSSTDGGYTCAFQVFGSTPCTPGFADVAAGGSWPTDSFDGPKYGKSPWFHKPWGNSGCGGVGGPWMTKSQMADIFNALLLSKANSSYNQYLSPPDGCLGPAGWNSQQVINQLHSLGIADVGDIGNIYVGFDGKGNSNSISVVSSTYGALVFNATDFYSIFFLRSPGTLSIQTSLFDTLICPPSCS